MKEAQRIIESAMEDEKDEENKDQTMHEWLSVFVNFIANKITIY